ARRRWPVRLGEGVLHGQGAVGPVVRAERAAAGRGVGPLAGDRGRLGAGDPGRGVRDGVASPVLAPDRRAARTATPPSGGDQRNGLVGPGFTPLGGRGSIVDRGTRGTVRSGGRVRTSRWLRAGSASLALLVSASVAAAEEPPWREARSTHFRIL